jgi:hypothetical protein
VTVPLGDDPNCRNWQVLIYFLIAHISELDAQIGRIVDRLHADGIDETATIVALWESTSEWLSALRDALLGVLSDGTRFSHFTRPTDQELSRLVNWSMSELKQT